ncbi:ABC transporter ATP-binding protein [Kineosporia succinea]|uniref:Simple sugar transport system ATP-binding protein n=1 Tax=Kineosporia succinea TaxID=84632 RepID=A0ABT9P783_9ACTN|nr:ABC transporter ATP-binding protein [Kineosporia succinea]MDP9828546.1 simple sugar transport system ATP-binding protein [Kineosporia succinea]
MSVPALELSGISKRFGPVVACDGVDLTVAAGEIHGLLGENGAGKSTLMRILLGLVRKDAGTVALGGEPVAIDDPQTAARLGLGMVHQHFSLIEPLTVWENVVLGDTGRVDRRRARADVERVASGYGLPVDPDARVADLSPGLRQRVELVKCLRRDPSVLILDEPTSVLTQAESAELFAVLRTLVRTRGRAVVLISHKLGEITDATDRVTVLRRGRVRFRAATAATSPAELAREMVGRDVSLLTGATTRATTGATTEASTEATTEATTGPTTGPTPASTVGPATASLIESRPRNPGQALRLRGLTAPGIGPVDLDVAPGEIVGVYGVEGNGQSELGRVLAGLLTPDRGTVEARGLGMIPEDRHHCGLVPDLSVTDNLLMKSVGTFSNRLGLLDRRAMRRRAQRLIDEFGIVTPSPDTPVRRLSGGNQQRVVLARELSSQPEVLVAARPTHGLDVGATEEMYERLRRAARDGVGVLLVSTELEEVMALASRIVVLSRGRVTGELTTAEATTERLGLLLGGLAA